MINLQEALGRLFGSVAAPRRGLATSSLADVSLADVPGSEERLRISLDGDHSSYHCGSAAAFAVIRQEAERAGCIVHGSKNYDILVMNGEGTMHHGSRGSHQKMEKIRRALESGKRVALVNTVWQSNPVEFAEVLRGCEIVVAREVLSQRELLNLGVNASVSPDQSYFAKIDESAPFIDYGGAAVFTDFWSEDFQSFVSLNSKWSARFPQLDMTSMTWSSVVKSLRTASVLVTGRHHAVYAACRAEIPFLAMHGNCHKIEGLVLSANCSIPVFRSFPQLRDALEASAFPTEAYQTLFSWLRAQAPWRLA